MTISIRHVAALLLFTVTPILAQSPPPHPEEQATVISAKEIEAALASLQAGPVGDAVLRVIPSDGQNVGVAVVRRSKINGTTPPDAMIHDAITEVYHVIEGHGILVTGGSLESATRLSADSPVVREDIGPSSAGKAISGGVRRAVGPGDVVVIPPHTPHGFVELQSDRIVYLIIRIDPNHLLEQK
jgi:mannose-6-phosphate isomerase-like protein (cupin superfamily)